jgi:hypothetical protein
LRLVIDPATNTAEGFYSTDGITYQNAGAAYTTQTLSISGMGLTTSTAYAGIYATHRNATTPVTYTFEDFNVQAVGTTNASLTNITTKTDEPGTNSTLGIPRNLQFKENVLLVSSMPGYNYLIINYVLANQGRTSITMYNIQGQLIKEIFTGNVNPGEYKQLRVDTDKLTNGIYLVCMRINGEVIMKKILLNK